MNIATQINEIRNLLQQLTGSTKDTMNTEEAAQYIGCSKSHLYKLTCNKLIPHYKPNGKFIYFDRDELSAWLKQNKVVSEYDLQEIAQNYVQQNQLEY